MKKNTSLHSLVKSLIPVEKAYIKKQLRSFSNSKKTTALILFEQIDKMEDYDEDLLLQRLKRLGIKGNLAVSKNQLFDTILRSLRMYREKNSYIAQLKGLIEGANILFEKGLYDLAQDLLQKATQLAQELGNHKKLIEISDLKRSYSTQLNAHNWMEDVTVYLKDRNSLLQQELDYSEYCQLYYQILFFIRQHRTIQTEEQAQQIEQLITHPILKKGQPDSFYANLYYLYIYNSYYFLKKEYPKALHYMQEIIELWENNEKILLTEPEKYLAALNNYYNSSIYVDNSLDLGNFLDKLKKLPTSNPRFNATVFETVFMWKGITFYINKNFDQIELLLQEYLVGLQSYTGLMNPVRELILLFNISSLYFLNVEYEKSLDFINKVLAFKHVALRADLQAIARIFHLIIHYEIGNIVLLEGVIRSHVRYLKNKSRYTVLESIIFKHVKNIIDLPKGKATQQGFSDFLTALEAYAQEDKFKTMSIFQNFNLPIWIKAKIKNIPLLEALSLEDNLL
ncbi:MAG: hypothetical protein GY810_27340 [Aureispira sp.]|nr:hypothetical protein [Aureispira sp.]